MAQMVMYLPVMQETWIQSLDQEDPLGKIPWRREWLSTPVLLYSCLENSMDREAWQAMVHGVAKSWTQLSD